MQRITSPPSSILSSIFKLTLFPVVIQKYAICFISKTDVRNTQIIGLWSAAMHVSSLEKVKQYVIQSMKELEATTLSNVDSLG
jgi:hypothetical protein